MEDHSARQVGTRITHVLSDKNFLKKLALPAQATAILLRSLDWEQALRPLLPIRRRLTCVEVLELTRPLLDRIAEEPGEGWLGWAYQVSVMLSFPRTETAHTSRQWDGALCYLRILQLLLDEERSALPFSPLFDFSFCTEDELAGSDNAKEYRRFRLYFRSEHLYEMLRLGQEVTPFHTLEHIAGVHHVAMTAARAFRTGGGLVDLPLLSGAAAAHDLGKFGCKAGEPVPYLHYH